MQKIRIYIVLMIALIAALAGVAYADDAARIGTDVYLPIQTQDDQMLLRIPLQGEGSICLARADEFDDFIPYQQGFICLSTTSDASAILYVHENTVETLYPFGAERADNLILYRDQLLVIMDHLLYSVDPDTGVKLKLSSAQMDECVIEGDTAYYIATADRISYTQGGVTGDAGCIYRLNLTTAGNDLLLKNGSDSLKIQSGTLYFHSLANAYMRDGELHGYIYSFDTAHQTLAPVCMRTDDGLWMLKAGLVAKHDDELCLHLDEGERTIYTITSDATIRSDGERMYIWCSAEKTLTEADALGTQTALRTDCDLLTSVDAALLTPEPALEPSPTPAIAPSASSDAALTWQSLWGEDEETGNKTTTSSATTGGAATPRPTAAPFLNDATKKPSTGTTAKATVKPTAKPTTKATVKPTTKPTAKPGDGSYIFPNSSKVKLTEAQVLAIDRSLWGYARNEIYARHGYEFKNSTYAKYFAKKSWYKPGGFSRASLNSVEWYNMELIKDLEARYPNGVSDYTDDSEYYDYDYDEDDRSDAGDDDFVDDSEYFDYDYDEVDSADSYDDDDWDDVPNDDDFVDDSEYFDYDYEEE